MGKLPFWFCHDQNGELGSLRSGAMLLAHPFLIVLIFGRKVIQIVNRFGPGSAERAGMPCIPTRVDDWRRRSAGELGQVEGRLQHRQGDRDEQDRMGWVVAFHAQVSMMDAFLQPGASNIHR